MKKITFLAKSVFFAMVLLGAANIQAQVELRVLTQAETRFNSVNDAGFGVTVWNYYDYETDQLTPIESEAFMMVSTNNDENVAGYVFYDEPEFILQAGYKIDGEWNGVGFTAEQNPYDYDENTPYSISSNSKYVTGQANIGFDYGSFLFNTETEELILAFDPEGEASASYSVNDSGIMAGWVDRPDAGGTLRVPAYRTLDGEYHLIPEGQLPTQTGENIAQFISNDNIMVGTFDLKPFIYDIDSNTFTSFDLPR